LSALIARLAGARTVRRVLVPASSVLLLVGMVGSLAPFYAGAVFDFKRAMISDLASPGSNPHGYLLADVGMVLWGALLVPVAAWLYRGLRRLHRGFAGLGALVFAAGLVGAIFIGVTGPVADVNSTVHVYVAFATFIFLAAGTLMLLGLAMYWRVEVRRGWLMLGLATMLQACILGFLLYLLWGQINDEFFFFNDTDLLRSIAFCEWTLGVASVAYVWLLVGAVGTIEQGAESARRL